VEGPLVCPSCLEETMNYVTEAGQQVPDYCDECYEALASQDQTAKDIAEYEQGLAAKG